MRVHNPGINGGFLIKMHLYKIHCYPPRSRMPPVVMVSPFLYVKIPQAVASYWALELTPFHKLVSKQDKSFQVRIWALNLLFVHL